MGYFGRRDIYVLDNIGTDEELILQVNNALSIHMQNSMEEDYLYNYRKGNQPVLGRKKERNSHICNKIVENHASEFVNFKNGYFLTQPAFYIARDKKKAKKVEKLNEYLYLSGKQQADNEVIDWAHCVGKGVLYVKPTGDDEDPCRAYALDPRNAFVAYSMNPSKDPVFGVHYVVGGADGNKIIADVYTNEFVYTIEGASVPKTPRTDNKNAYYVSKIVSKRENVLGLIPIIEYKANGVGMACFEEAMPLLDAISDIQSNRCDGIAQFIQSVMVATNVEFEDGTTAEQIKSSGLICLKSTSDTKADVKILSEQLDQQQTQTLVDNLYKQALTISAMPDITGSSGSSSDTGVAVIYRQGWASADASARNTEDLFKKSNEQFDKIFLRILETAKNFKIDRKDYELHFVRNENANIQSKAQSLYTLLSAGVDPVLAFAKSGISNDPVADVEQSKETLIARWGAGGSNGEADNQDPIAKLNATSDTSVDEQQIDNELEEKQTTSEKEGGNDFANSEDE